MEQGRKGVKVDLAEHTWLQVRLRRREDVCGGLYKLVEKGDELKWLQCGGESVIKKVDAQWALTDQGGSEVLRWGSTAVSPDVWIDTREAAVRFGAKGLASEVYLRAERTQSGAVLACGGKYVRDGGCVLGAHVWQQEDGEMAICAGTDGRFYVTTKKVAAAQLSRGALVSAGPIRSEQPHMGRHPGEMIGWEVDSGSAVHSWLPTTEVQCSTMPTAVAGLLVVEVGGKLRDTVVGACAGTYQRTSSGRRAWMQVGGDMVLSIGSFRYHFSLSTDAAKGGRPDVSFAESFTGHGGMGPEHVADWVCYDADTHSYVPSNGLFQCSCPSAPAAPITTPPTEHVRTAMVPATVAAARAGIGCRRIFHCSGQAVTLLQETPDGRFVVQQNGSERVLSLRAMTMLQAYGHPALVAAEAPPGPYVLDGQLHHKSKTGVVRLMTRCPPTSCSKCSKFHWGMYGCTGYEQSFEPHFFSEPSIQEKRVWPELEPECSAPSDAAAERLRQAQLSVGVAAWAARLLRRMDAPETKRRKVGTAAADVADAIWKFVLGDWQPRADCRARFVALRSKLCDAAGQGSIGQSACRELLERLCHTTFA